MLTRLLLEKDISTFRFDFFGHGESDGPFADLTVTRAVQQTLNLIHYMAGKDFSKIALMGSSFGGLVALITASRYSQLSALALKCPVVDFPEELNLELGRSGMSEWKNTNTIPNFTGQPGRLKLSFDFYEDCLRHVGYQVATSITAPTIIVQGKRDELIPIHQCQHFFELVNTEKSLHLLPEADHQFSKREDFLEMVDLIQNWLSSHLLSSTPST